MENLKNALLEINDDYLAGLSNKGTVKRAYKDLENTEISAVYQKDSAEISVGSEKCLIKFPVPQSQCSCPSRVICRHIITALLWLKENLKDMPASPQSEKKTQETISPKISLEEQLSAVSLKEIKQAMKKKSYSSFIEKAKVGFLPSIEELSIITVDIPEENMIVKLISPLEYSSCTCHSKELCKHKAAAILTWQIKHKIISLDELEKTDEIKKEKLDLKEIREAAEYALEFLSELLSHGLVRTSDDIAEQAESVAVLCHNAKLADSERNIREIGNRLSAYTNHSPEFHSEMLFSLILESIMLLNKILSEKDELKLKKLMGEFKAKYSASDMLQLVPIAKRFFSSVAGYEGDIYYFLNKTENAERKFLTYSNIRPTFYENNRGGRNTFSAPWGLYGNMDELLRSELKLTFPKLSGGKISSSSETKAEIIKKVDLNRPEVKDLIYTDFSELISQTFSKEMQDETDRLVLAAPFQCIRSVSDEITQTHSILIEDIFQQRISVKARYTSDSKEFFQAFARIGEQMMKNPEKQFVIFGNAYIENGKCCIYPIAVFDNIEIDFKQKEMPFQTFENKHDYFYFAEYFKEVKKMLGDMIQCGINSFDLSHQIFEFSEESEKMGLLVLSKKLSSLAEKLEAQNHQIKNNHQEIIRILSEINGYISIGITRTQVQLAIENLLVKENDSK